MSKTFKFVSSKTQKLNDSKQLGDELKKCKLQELYESEKLLFIKTKMRDLIKKEWNEGLIYKDFKEFYDEEIGKNDNTNYFWITVNPVHTVTLGELQKEVERYVKRTFIKSYIYVYEQRGSDKNEKEMGQGLHVHLLIERDMSANVSPYDIQKRTRIAFKSICDSQNKSILHFKQMPEEYIVDKLNYMTNKNLDEEHKDKEEKQEYDRVWRVENQLRNYYALGSLKLKYEDYIKCQEPESVELLESQSVKLKESSTIQDRVLDH